MLPFVHEDGVLKDKKRKTEEKVFEVVKNSKANALVQGSKINRGAVANSYGV